MGLSPVFSAATLIGPTTVSITLRVVDAGGLSSENFSTVSVTNSGPIVHPDSFTILENVANGTFVGTVFATDFPGDVLTYSVVGGTGPSAFSIDSASGQIVVADRAQLDYETNASFTLTVRVVDQNGGEAIASMIIHLLNQASVSGVVFVDSDGDGNFDAGESGLAGVAVELLNTDGDVLFSTLTDSSGFYFFEDLAAGEYRIRELQPAGYVDGPEYPGSLGGTVVSNDVIGLMLTDLDAVDYNFSEMAVGGQLTSGDTAGIGFWQNNHGQTLIAQGGTALANWLTQNFPNIFGNQFSGASGSDVARFYKDQLFRQKSKNAAGPAKVDAQFMAVALATFFTSSNLAGNVAVGYGFNVTTTGIGNKIVNIGARGAAFGAADHSTLTIMQILLATNGLTDQPNHQSGFACIYDTNGDGVIDTSERQLRTLANDLFDWINSFE